jgi:phosphatidylglycerol:prolipoprotein diacylglycerol transferase
MGFVHDIDPVMLSLGGFEIYWYGFAYTFGFAGMILWFWLKRPLLGWTVRDVVLASILMMAAILTGGRLFEIAVYEWDWYRAHPADIPNLWKGGMASHGLLLGAVSGAAIVARVTRTPLLKLLDILTVAAAFLFGLGRIGNFIEGGVIGTVTTLPWGVKLPDVEGFRHPVSLYDGVKNLLLVPVLIGVLQRWPAGEGVATGVFLAGYGGLRFVVDQFRDYESALWGMGPGQWFNLIMLAAGLALLAARRRRPLPVVEAPAPAPRNPSALAVVLFVALLLIPLGIPTSWTAEYIHQKRSASP